MPTLYLSGAADPLLLACPPALMDGWLDDHRGTVMIDGAGHWVHQQRPAAVNEALLWFLSDVASTGPDRGVDDAPAGPDTDTVGARLTDAHRATPGDHVVDGPAERSIARWRRVCSTVVVTSPRLRSSTARNESSVRRNPLVTASG